jgi:hypothetical protein
MLSSPVGEFISELQTSEIPEGIMKHSVFRTKVTELIDVYLLYCSILHN